MNKAIAVIQARITSSRLPAKILLPISGIPLIVLAAKRASNTGRQVLVATSEDNSDDTICNILEKYSIAFFRGSLNNVLKRYVDALKIYPDNQLIFRLTADNVLPDGELLDQMEEEFHKRRLNYLICNGAKSGLPYGVSAELMKLIDLREANNSVPEEDKFSREHVTQWIRKKYGENYFKKYLFREPTQARATIDNLREYLQVEKIFSKVDNPINISFLNLTNLIEQKLDSSSEPVTDMVLGGAQLGLNYGIANKNGKPCDETFYKLILTAINNGLAYIDTASAYGDSEKRVGKVLASEKLEHRIKVITKLSPFESNILKLDSNLIVSKVRESVFSSLLNLKTQQLYCLMLHRASHLKSEVLVDALLTLQKNGYILNIGVSVQSPNELDQALSNPYIKYIQMPYNILDNRWEAIIDKIKSAKLERNIKVHIRSVFLQGLLFSDDQEIWLKANCKESKKIRSWIRKTFELSNYPSESEFFINYVRSQDWIDAIVVGNDNLEHLKKNINAFTCKKLDEAQLNFIKNDRPILGNQTLDPSKWKN